MSLMSEIEQIIRDEVPDSVAKHDRDGHDKLHEADISALASRIATHVQDRQGRVLLLGVVGAGALALAIIGVGKLL